MDYVPSWLRLRGTISGRTYAKSVRGQIYSSFIQSASTAVITAEKTKTALGNVALTSGTQRVKQRKIVPKRTSNKREIVLKTASNESLLVTVDSPPVVNTVPLFSTGTEATTVATRTATPFSREGPIYSTTHQMPCMPMSMASTSRMMPMYGNTYSYMPYTNNQLMPNYSMPSQPSVESLQPIHVSVPEEPIIQGRSSSDDLLQFAHSMSQSCCETENVQINTTTTESVENVAAQSGSSFVGLNINSPRMQQMPHQPVSFAFDDLICDAADSAFGKLPDKSDNVASEHNYSVYEQANPTPGISTSRDYDTEEEVLIEFDDTFNDAYAVMDASTSNKRDFPDNNDAEEISRILADLEGRDFEVKTYQRL